MLQNIDCSKLMARIFISYSRADRQFIDQFILLIRRVYGNDSTWFDDNIHGGDDWWQMILNEIAECDIFVYLISNEALESPYCQAELREALRLNKLILPVIVRRLKPEYPRGIDDALAVVLPRTQYVDMSGCFRDPNTIATLYAALTRPLNAIPQQTATSVTPSPTPEPPLIDVLHCRLWLVENNNRGSSDLLKATLPNKYLLRLTAQTLDGQALASEPTPGAVRDNRTN